MIRLKDKALLCLALATLFGSGLGTGFLLARRGQTSPLTSGTQPPAETAAAVAAGDWQQRAMDQLSTDLSLTPPQQQTVGNLLKLSTDQVFRNRDRAMFQIHLELLAFHDAVAGRPQLLDASQLQRLNGIRNRLRKQIETQFPQFLRDNPLPITAQVSP